MKFPEPRKLAAGHFHNLIISNAQPGTGSSGHKAAGSAPKRETSAVYGFGRIGYGQLGPFHAEDEKTSQRLTKGYVPEPQLQSIFSGKYIEEVGCGIYHSVALVKGKSTDDAGDVYAWGLGNGGRLAQERPTTDRKCKELLEATLLPRDGIDKVLKRPRWIPNLINDQMRPQWSLEFPVKVTFSHRGTQEKIARIACGNDYTLALTDRGEIFAWGVGSYGNLGTGLICDEHVPKVVRLPHGAKCCMVAAGTKHSMAISDNASGNLLYSWGHGGQGRLGHGESFKAALTPTRIESAEIQDLRMEWIACGEAHSASIDHNGGVWCWGAGSFNRLGHGEGSDEPTPKCVTSLGGRRCGQIELGTLHSLALLTDKGDVYSWGSGPATYNAEGFRVPAEVKLMGKAKAIAAGCFHSVVMLEDGRVFAFGNSGEGRLGTEPKDLKEPNQVPQIELMYEGRKFLAFVPVQAALEDKEPEESAGQTEPEPAEPQEKPGKKKAGVSAPFVKAVACGGMHTAAIDMDNDLWFWGSGEYFQTSHFQGEDDDPQHEDVVQPRLATSLRSILKPFKDTVKLLALGLEHSLVVTTNGQLYAWGRNSSGQLGLGGTNDRAIPTLVHSVPEVAGAAAGENHSIAFVESGEVYSWGATEAGKLGHGASVIKSIQHYPKQIKKDASFSGKVVQASCGTQHTALIVNGGGLYTFGAAWYGRLGHGDTSNQYSPKLIETVCRDGDDFPVNGDFPIKFRDVRCGPFHTLAITNENHLYAFGRDVQVLSDDHVLVPTLFEKLDLAYAEFGAEEVQMVAVGSNFSLVLTNYSNLWVWGDSKKGQFGVEPPKKKPAKAKQGEKSAKAEKIEPRPVVEEPPVKVAEEPPAQVEKEERRPSMDEKAAMAEPVEAAETEPAKEEKDETPFQWIRGRFSRFGGGEPPMEKPAEAATDEPEKVAEEEPATVEKEECRPLKVEEEESAQEGGAEEHLELAEEELKGPHLIKGPVDNWHRRTTRDRGKEPRIIDVAAGYSHIIVLLNDGECYSWGSQGGGRLGLADPPKKGNNAFEPVVYQPSQVKSIRSDEKAKFLRDLPS